MYTEYTVSLEEVNASLETTLPNFMNFYRDHGIRTTSQLVSLRDNTITGFVFPLATVLHYTTRSIGSLGILPEDPLLENMGNRILVDAVLRYEGDILGQPIWLNRQVTKDIRAYVNKHKKFTYLANAKGAEHLNGIPQVINYSDLDRSYRYAQRTGVPYQRTHNYYSTVVNHLSKMHTENSNKNHFILMDLPSIIPAPSRLRDAEAEIVRAKDPANPMSQKNYARFDSDGRFIILHLWMWAGEHKDLSIFSAWTEEELEKVNLLFTIDDRFSVLNLGVFNRWIKHGEEDGKNLGVFTNKNAQIALLRHFMSLQEISTVAADVEIIDDESQNEIAAVKGDAPKDMTALAKNLEGELEPVTEVNVDAVGVTKAPINITAKNAVDQTSIKKAFADKTDKVDFSDDNNPVGDKELNEILGSELERDMAQLEIVEAQRDADHLNAVRDYVPYKANDFSHNGKINQLVDSLADKGLLSAAEVRRAKNLGERYKTIKSPFDESKTLEQFVEIDKETLKIPPKVPLVSRDIKGVVDKSMLDYSIKDFDNRYIKDVLNKHVVRAVLHAQQSGIAVTDMSMTRVDSYLGSHINLRCQFTPIIGRPSTVNFQLPIIDRNGIFVANGVKYKMRKQRADQKI